MNPGCDVRDEGNGEIERNYPTSKFEQQRRNSDLCEVDYNHRSTLTDFNILSTLSEDGRYDYTESDDSMDYDTLSPKESTQKHEWSLQYEESTAEVNLTVCDEGGIENHIMNFMNKIDEDHCELNKGI